ncbi:hypothetical protein [Marisediminicola senii]|uniref:hypothetical protein n=1 Tax=Marisediminicola senii TaxID=2711233 RepID=UPI0013EE1718|nr:hypothetical protein [Marisediminicola senii]
MEQDQGRSDRERRAGESAFDPRFDPAFQPGYDASADRSRSRGGAPVRPLSRTASASDSGARRPMTAPPVISARMPPSVAELRAAEQRAAEQREFEQRGYAAAQGPAASMVTAPRATGDAQVHATADPDRDHNDDDDAADPAGSRRNPFVIVLWVISAALILGGLALLQWLPELERLMQRGQLGDGSSTITYAYYLSVIEMAPLVLVLGVATAIGLLFLHAARWQRHPQRG